MMADFSKSMSAETLPEEVERNDRFQKMPCLHEKRRM